MFPVLFRRWVFVVLFAFVSVTASAQFTLVEVTPTAVPAGFENSVSYRVSYFESVNGQAVEVFPSRAQKEKDFDLIMAQVVRYVIANEYEAKGRHLDETSFESCTNEYALQLVSNDYVTKAWKTPSVNAMAAYLQANAGRLAVNKLLAYLDYQAADGQYVSGLDVDPVLFHFGQGQERDTVTVTLVTTEIDK